MLKLSKIFRLREIKRVSNETIKIYGDIDLNKDYSEKDLNVITNNLYETNFFEDIKIDLNNNVLKISLKEYPTINQLLISGEKSKRYKDQIKKIIQLKEMVLLLNHIYQKILK